MKIAILNDTHCGAKNGSEVFLNNAEKFYSELFFPYLEENNISRILHLGDYFEHRKYINFKALNRNKKMFLDVLQSRNIRMDIIPGNHDVYYKNTNKLNSLTECLRDNPQIDIHMTPQDLDYGVGVIPWICSENETEVFDYLRTTKCSVVMGHLELAGFKYMGNANIKSHGMDKNIFKRFEAVYSGHYHTKSQQDNITYLGTQLELTWSDAGDPKYFHVYDTDTREIEAIRNPFNLYQKLVYDDENPTRITEELISGKFIKIIVTSKKDLYEFDKYLEKVYNFTPHEVKIVESLDEFSSDNIDDEKVSTVDTQTLLNDYVDAAKTNLDNDKLKKMLQELFIEAQADDSI